MKDIRFAPPTIKSATSDYAGKCAQCDEVIHVGERTVCVFSGFIGRERYHVECYNRISEFPHR